MNKKLIINLGLYGGLLFGLLLGNQQSVHGQTYCTPAYTYGCSSGDGISNVTLNGQSVNLNNTTTCSAGGYGDYTSSNNPDLVQGASYTISVSTSYTSPSSEDVRIWIDYNNDGTFQASEEIANTNGNGMATTGTNSFTFTVPATATPGSRRMRVRLAWLGGNSIDPCASESYGEAEDYTVNIVPLAPPDNAGVDSLINPREDGNFCSGQQLVKVRLSNLGQNALDSVDLYWSVDGVLQSGKSFVFNPSLDSISSPNNDTIITLGYVVFPYQTSVNIKAWTSNPNGVIDTDPTDDTLDLDIIANIQGVSTEISPGDTAICAGSSLVLDAGQQPPGSIFIWNNNMVTQQISVNQPGDYSVIVQSLGGCFAYDTVTITQIPQPVAGDFGVVDNGGMNFTFTPINMQNVSNYHWDFGDSTTLDVATDAPQVHHYARTGTYAVSLTVSSDEKCDAISIEKQVYVQPSLGIGELSKFDEVLKVYPNPTNDRLNIQSQVSNVALQGVAIYNMLGKKVFVQNLSGSDAQISLAHLPAGIYQARIQTTKGVVNSRIEILR